MRILVLGGTVFLSHAIAAEAAARGHEVVAAARGESGGFPVGVRHVPLDRTAPDWSSLTGPWDAVVDVARIPSWVRSAVEALREHTDHWVFVSTASVYADHATRGGTPATLPLLAPTDEEGIDAYGGAKVACEDAVRASFPEALIARPGLIVGPGDPSGRFTYWAERLADPEGEVLAPGDPDDPAQVIDVRDLAAWLVDSCEVRRSGTLDTIGPSGPLGDLLEAIAPGRPLTWVPADFLEERDVEPWMGPRSVPLWLPADHAGLATHDVREFLATGVSLRPVAETARDTLSWLAATPDAVRTGLTRQEEQELLADWHTIRG